MWLAEPKNPHVERHPLWNPETLKEELKQSSSTLTEICKRYAPSAKNWRALYADVRRWRAENPELEELFQQHRLRTDSRKRVTVSGGRVRKDADPEHADWKTKYCEELLRTKSRTKAALVTPYPWDSIYKMLHEKYSEYDQKFADMVHMVETRLVAWAEEEIWNSLSDATNAKDRAWIADRILSKMDRERWGDKLDVKHTGAIQHLLPQQRLMLLGEAAADQAVFIAEGNVPKQLGTGEPVPMDFGSIERKKSDEEDVIDAEVINE